MWQETADLASTSFQSFSQTFLLPLFLFLFPSAKPFSAALVSHGWEKSAREIRCPSPLVIFQLSVWLTSSLQTSSSRVYHLSSTFLLLFFSFRAVFRDLRPPITIFVPCAYNFSSSQDRFSLATCQLFRTTSIATVITYLSFGASVVFV